ncbi:RNA polymerase sigma factor [Leptolyngbya sp. 7M]|uniref:RNA polymerase sigma factor n=1 Tax=Leptolyngbya sp. 7M TaxID=2812896 RepID=UPI001B8CB50E|nr:RNA polymerase sigma factor [Leptolyngbya sp. 7M]QYO66346.1 RNA polymerase sigma factor [Leptolyngbya sp. 7M]
MSYHLDEILMAQNILKRIANGDQSAVQDCLKAYGGLVWSLARRMLRNSDDAEDAVQEVFVDVWKNAGRFDESQSSETTFIAMIARRRLIDKIRFTQRRISADSIEDLLSEPARSDDADLQMLVEGREAFRALKELRPEQQQVLQLSIVHGLSHQEISDATGMPLGTVKTHARRGLIQARELLGIKNSSKEASI